MEAGEVLICSCPLHLLPGHRGARGDGEIGETGGTGGKEGAEGAAKSEWARGPGGPGETGWPGEAGGAGEAGERPTWRGLWGGREAQFGDHAVRQEEPQRTSKRCSLPSSQTWGLLPPGQLLHLLLPLLLLLPGATCDIPTCNQEAMGDNPFCIPTDYNKDLIPPTEGPLEIFVDIFIFEVSKINDIELTMTFELYFDLSWTESRFHINESSPKWGEDGSVMGSTNFVSSLWLPDIQIFKCKQFKKRQIVTDVAGLILFKSRQLLYTVSTEVIVDCPMKFSGYPLDHQSCKFLVGSYIHDNLQINFSGKWAHDVDNQRAQQYILKCVDLNANDTTIYWANRTYSQTGFQVDMIRRRTPVLLQVYLPSGLFVIVSWISFIVPPEVVPGRMALLVTLFLVLVNIFNSVTGNAPKAEGLTAVETWVVSCIIHVFGVLAEYALILKIIQSEKRRDAKARRAFLKVLNTSNGISEPSKSSIVRRHGGANSATTELFETEPLNGDGGSGQGKSQHEMDREWNNHQRDSRCVREKIQMAYEKVDRVAMYLFPGIFFFFNLLYWTYYLIVVNIFDLSLF